MGWRSAVPTYEAGIESAMRAGPAQQAPGSVNRGEEATGGAIEREASVLPGCALTETCQPLHVTPDRTGIRLVLLRQRVRLGGLLLRQIESLHGRVEHRVARVPELLGRRTQEQGAFGSGVGVERVADLRRVTLSTPPESTRPRAGAGSRPRAGSPR